MHAPKHKEKAFDDVLMIIEAFKGFSLSINNEKCN
jgi:hypothetical protein